MSYFCNSCTCDIPQYRTLVVCQTCLNYHLCADCHVTQSFMGALSAEHQYNVYVHGRQVASNMRDVQSFSRGRGASQETPSSRLTTTPGATIPKSPASLERYWGAFLICANDLSPMFNRLVAAIFAAFDHASTGVLQPFEFCEMMVAAGYTTAEFPPLSVPANGSAPPTALHQLDAWLAGWYRSFPLDHRMSTREFPPPPPVPITEGCIRKRDRFFHTMMHSPASVVPNGLPLLSQLGMKQYLRHQALHDPENHYVRLNHLLDALPRLVDPETDLSFEQGLIPRACFPSTPDRGEEEMQRTMQSPAVEVQQEMERRQAEYMRRQMEGDHAINMATATARSNVLGGWRVGPDGAKVLQGRLFLAYS